MKTKLTNMKTKLTNMKTKLTNLLIISLFYVCVINSSVQAQELDDFKFEGFTNPLENTVKNENNFNGYTRYWQDDYNEWIRYGNLFKMSIPNVEKSIAQSKIDIAEDLQIPGLLLQEGFLNGLLTDHYISLEQPTFSKLEEAIKQENVLIFINPESEVGKKLVTKLPNNFNLRSILKDCQNNNNSLNEINAFYLVNGKRKIFVVSSKDKILRDHLRDIIDKTIKLLSDYDMHRGWFGTKTLLNSVTCEPGQPLEIIGKGMNEGNDWFVFDGYMDFLMKDKLTDWIGKTGLSVVTDVGFSPIYGCKDYNGLQVQDMGTQKGAWINFAHEKKGYIFRPVYDPEGALCHYDGYIATEGNKEQIDKEDVPFISETGFLRDGLNPCMVLFVKKGEQLTKDKMWEAILKCREVAILNQGEMMGPPLYRNALELLLLDRIFLEEYFGDRINVETTMENYQLNVTLTNTYAYAISGTLEIVLPPELKIKGIMSTQVNLPSKSSKTLQFEIQPLASAMGKTNPIAVYYKWGANKKSTLTMMNLPPVISVHRLLYGLSPRVKYPVTIHNFSEKQTFPVKIEVLDKNNPKKVVYNSSKSCSTGTGTFKDMLFDIEVSPGSYNVKVTALGVDNLSQLGVGKATGVSHAYAVDLNNDGIKEYRMENNSVRVTLLATGARIIEYIVKSRNDNVFFKLWPKRPIDYNSPFRKRKYYPYGGFEDFLGQPSLETHRVYDAKIIKKEGDFVRVRMVSDFYGNKLQKTFTLYGNSPLVEIRYALTFKNPELNVIGPQPILSLGKAHGPEDVFTVSTLNGIQQFRMRPESNYGRIFHLKEGWNAGYDTREDISFIGAYPVTQPLFLHMWMNTPKNSVAHYYYTEWQLWVPIYQKSTMYFSYYIWGTGGSWQDGVKALRERNLITTK